jgi:hypothetical protein
MSSSQEPPSERRPVWQPPTQKAAPPTQAAQPSLSSLLRLLPVFQNQLRDAENRAQQAMLEAESLRQIVSGLQTLAGQRPISQGTLFLSKETVPPQPEGPRGQEAVRQVMATAPDEIWPIGAITAEITKRGWIDPDAKTPGAAIRAATQRLASAGKAEKVGPARYRLTARGREEPD